MKIQSFRKLGEAAHALLVTLILGSILCIFVVYYLSLIEQQNRFGARSQVWNTAITVAEAGIEEALQELNTNPTPLATDGWAANGTTYWRTNHFADGNWYAVSINLSNTTSPELISRGFVSPPAMSQADPATFFAAYGVNASPSTISRAVRVRCKKGNLFTAAMVSKHAIDLKGNGVATDSYDSSNPAKSTDGKYDPFKYQGDYGDVATDDSIIVGVDNANIYGHLHTGASGGYSLGPQGGVGTHAWQAAHGGGMEPNFFAQDANFTFPDTTPPNTNGFLAPQPGDIVVASNTIVATPITTNTVPGSRPWGGVSTNVGTYTTVSTYPNPVPAGLVTNTTMATSATYPNPAPASGVTTNIAGYTTSATRPSPVPAGTTTNTTWINNSASVPSPAPAGTVTNIIMVNNSATLPSPVPSGSTTNFHNVRTKSMPSPGSYMPGSLVYDGVKWYTYDQIDSYNYPTYTYNYPTYTYTYPSSYTYTYAVYTYTYPNYTFSYNLYQTNTVYITNHYDNVLYGDHDYVTSSLSGSTIVKGPNVRLVLPNGLSGGENITFDYSNWNTPGLTVYAGGTSASISGNQYINPSGFAGSLIVYCAPSVTSFTLNGNGQFTGVLVAPNANLALNGGGHSDEDFCGSLMVNSVRLNGHFKFHWDEALGHMDANGRILAMSWDEIP